MTNFKSFIPIIGLYILLLSCDSSQHKNSKNKLDLYTNYIDSITQLPSEEAFNNWEMIVKGANSRKNEVENAFKNDTKSSVFDENYQQYNKKYDAYSKSVAAALLHYKNYEKEVEFRTELLTYGEFGDDMSFEWINRKDIVLIYHQFSNTLLKKKDAYSATQWTEINKLYQALENRKNVLQKEGIKNDDFTQIVASKTKIETVLKAVELHSVK